MGWGELREGVPGANPQFLFVFVSVSLPPPVSEGGESGWGPRAACWGRVRNGSENM